MKSHNIFYICPICFNTSETSAHCHGRAMIKYDACAVTGDQRKPVADSQGRFKSRAPRWFVEAISGPRAAAGMAA